MVNKIADILKENHTPLYEEFIAKRANLHKKYLLWKENADVLFTLQRFFKVRWKKFFSSASIAAKKIKEPCIPELYVRRLRNHFQDNPDRNGFLANSLDSV